MKKFLIKKGSLFLLLLFALGACKSSETAPDFAQNMAGQYGLEYLNLAGTEITPQFMALVGGTAVVTVEKKADSKISLYVKSVVRGNTTEVQKEFTLSDAGSGAANVLEAGKRVGTFTNSKIDISTMHNGGVFALTAKKL